MEQGNKTNFWWVFQLKKQEGRETSTYKEGRTRKEKGREIGTCYCKKMTIIIEERLVEHLEKKITITMEH